MDDTSNRVPRFWITLPLLAAVLAIVWIFLPLLQEPTIDYQQYSGSPRDLKVWTTLANNPMQIDYRWTLDTVVQLAEESRLEEYHLVYSAYYPDTNSLLFLLRGDNNSLADVPVSLPYSSPYPHGNLFVVDHKSRCVVGILHVLSVNHECIRYAFTPNPAVILKEAL